MGGAQVLPSRFPLVLLLFCSHSPLVHPFVFSLHPEAAAATFQCRTRVSAIQLDAEPRPEFISHFSVPGFGLVSLRDVNRADDPIGEAG
jgi:hypothetical protein